MTLTIDPWYLYLPYIYSCQYNILTIFILGVALTLDLWIKNLTVLRSLCLTKFEINPCRQSRNKLTTFRDRCMDRYEINKHNAFSTSWRKHFAVCFLTNLSYKQSGRCTLHCQQNFVEPHMSMILPTGFPAFLNKYTFHRI